MRTIRTGGALQRTVTAVFVAGLLCVTTGIGAQPADDRPLRLVAPSAPGSGHDLSTRILADGLSAELGQVVIVENRPGADGIIAAERVATAAPDGQTLLSGLGSQFAINPAIHARLPYDPQRDLKPVSLVARQVLLLAVHPSLPVSTPQELAAWSRAHPGTVDYSSATPTFMLAAESFKRATGADMQHIPYASGAPAVNALVAGTVEVSFISATSALPLAKAGKIRVLAVSGPARLPELPDVPTLTEAGLVDEVPVWSAVFAPGGTPDAVVDRLHRAIVRAIARPEIRERYAKGAELLVGSTPAELAETVARDAARMKALTGHIGLAPK
ncbi:MAG: tripartite tricarboxylate transporter substrate binding protein [Burkholderiales bacterium]|nr:tripartite tricarboxylate transporter substrate binding protein [Burkholderiales bacterium]MCE7876384.1 tripartite tricarboxylate transporter substrate binding protein [Betaproteobacteria bacterium PRO3]